LVGSTFLVSVTIKPRPRCLHREAVALRSARESPSRAAFRRRLSNCLLR